jgi:hypothetical protein
VACSWDRAIEPERAAMVERARCCPTPSSAHRPCHRCRCECAHAGLLGPTVPIRLFSSVYGAVLQERCIRASGGSGAPSLRRRRTLAALMGAKARRPVALRMEWALFDCRQSAGHRGQLQVRKSQRPCAPLAALRPPVAPLSAVDCASACDAACTAEPTRSELVARYFGVLACCSFCGGEQLSTMGGCCGVQRCHAS